MNMERRPICPLCKHRFDPIIRRPDDVINCDGQCFHIYWGADNQWHESTYLDEIGKKACPIPTEEFNRISTELHNVCYFCGYEIESTATLCPHCKRNIPSQSFIDTLEEKGKTDPYIKEALRTSRAQCSGSNREAYLANAMMAAWGTVPREYLGMRRYQPCGHGPSPMYINPRPKIQREWKLR